MGKAKENNDNQNKVATEKNDTEQNSEQINTDEKPKGEHYNESEIESLDIEEKFNILAQEVERWRDLAMRSQAELTNFRKRIAKEKNDAVKYANSELFKSLLPVIDNFSFGLQASKNSTDPKSIIIGMEMVEKQITDFLTANDIVEIKSEGEKFDPHIHEAQNYEHDEKVPEGVVIKENRKGYKMHDRLLRPAYVVVSKGSEKSEDKK